MNSIIKLFLVVLVAGSLASCENFLGGDYNQDPNNALTVPVAAQMPSIEINIADVTGGAFSRFSCMLSQQVAGVARQWASFNQYTGLTPNRFDAAWQNVYENILNEIKTAQASSAADGNNHTLGALNVMEAYTLMMATDVWGDMPYSEALNGIENTNPQYDSQSDIYAKINTLIADAISLFDGPQGPVAIGGDVIHGGDATAWRKTAVALRARGKLHNGDLSGAATDAADSYGSSDDNFAYQYPDANAAGQWYRFNRDRTGDLEFGPTLRDLMASLNDTMRLSAWDQTFTTDHTYLVPNFNQEMVTYREMQFIVAEASPTSAEGHQAYLNGIKASFDRSGLDSTAYGNYVSQPEVDPGVGNLTKTMVMTQKYIAMFLQPETYSDYRRTNVPDLSPVSGPNVPVRWNYASDEYLFNANSPSETDVNIYTDRVGWNK